MICLHKTFVWTQSISIVPPVTLAKAEQDFNTVSFPGTYIALEVASAGEHNLLLSFYSTQKIRKQFCVGSMQVQKTFEDAKEVQCEARDCVVLRKTASRDILLETSLK